MQYYNNILTVEAGWLIANGIMSEANYKKLAIRHDIHVVRRGCRSTEALVEYDSMPERFRRRVEAIKNPYSAARFNSVEPFIEHNAEASVYFDDYCIDGTRHLPVEKRREYYTNAIVLGAIQSLINSRTASRHARGKVAARFWDEISEDVQSLDMKKWPHSLPANPRSLERKYKLYRTEGYESLIHQNYRKQIKNAAKVQDDVQLGVLETIIAHQNNLDDMQICTMYNAIAKVSGWKPITDGTVRVWRMKLEDYTYARRHGSRNYATNRAMQVKRSVPTAPLTFWTLDGWESELFYRDSKSYYNRLVLEVVLDECTEYPIGYAIGRSESADLIREALRNAALHTQELFGQMYKVNQVQADHYADSQTDAMFGKMAVHATKAKVGNAKAKPIERYFKRLNSTYCQMQLNWSGYGITSKKSLQPNIEIIQKTRYQFPDKNGAIQQLVTIIEAERAKKRDAYMQAYAACDKSRLTPMSREQFLLAYGATTGQKNLLTGAGLKITIGGQVRTYECFDPHMREHMSVRWQVRYDSSDLHTALAVNDDESLRFIIEEKHTQPMALADRKDGDSHELQRILDFNRLHDEMVTDHICNAQALAEQHMVQRRELADLSKFLLTDKNGQHKNVRSAKRLAVAGGVTEVEPIDDTQIGTELLDQY